jgi:hypothetical protein
MPTALSTLQPGHRLGPYEIIMTVAEARAYARAVGGPDSPDYGDTLPTLAIIALGLSRIIDDLGLGAGTIHAGQEVELHRPVRVGETITATAELKSNAPRKDVRFATVATEFKDGTGAVVATASSTVIVPA